MREDRRYRPRRRRRDPYEGVEWWPLVTMFILGWLAFIAMSEYR